jgi:hypothetical protein
MQPKENLPTHFLVICDDDHKWLNVTRKDLRILGVEARISPLSFERPYYKISRQIGHVVPHLCDEIYLHEGADTRLFIRAYLAYWKESRDTDFVKKYCSVLFDKPDPLFAGFAGIVTETYPYTPQ